MADSLFDTTNDNTARSELEAKWKDKPADELLKAKVESDLYIKTLERQKDELRNDYLKLREEANAQAKLKELLDRLENTSIDSKVTPTIVNNLESKPTEPNYDEIVSKSMQKLQAEAQAKQNFNLVQLKLKERYGDNYSASLQEQISTLGITGDELNEMARTRPTVLIKALGLDAPIQRDPFQSPVRSSSRNDNFSPRNDKRTWSFYQNMKKENPTLYYNKKTQFQMHQDAGALGTAFEDGDFHAL